MNTATAGAEVVQQQTDEQAAQATQDAEDAFAKGFNSVAGKPDSGEEGTETQSAATPEPGAAAEQQEQLAAADAAAGDPAVDEWAGVPPKLREKMEALESLPGQVRNLAGHIGGLNNGVKELKAALDTAKAASTTGKDAPTQDAIASAAGSSEKWDRLKEDFPEWAEGIEERLAKSGGGKAVDVDALRRDVTGDIESIVSAGVDVAEERAFVRFKHPDWKNTVKTPEFKAWLETQPKDIKSLTGSALADDTIKVLDSYGSHRQTLAATEADRARKQRRLQGATTPGGKTSGVTATGISDEQAFERGYKKVARTP